jgi:polar amino acid transport system permease protein
MEELLRRTQLVIQINFHVLEAFVATALFYLLMTTLWGLVQGRLESHFGKSVAGVSPRSTRGGAAGIVANASIATSIDPNILEKGAR